MKKDIITSFYESEIIGYAERRFAGFIQRLSGNDDPDLGLAAALLCRAVMDGDVCLDLSAPADRLLPGTEAVLPDFRPPKPEAWAASLARSCCVGGPGDFTPLVLDGHRLYLHRFHNWESELAEQVRERSEGIHFSGDAQAVRQSLARLFPENRGAFEDRQKLAAICALLKRFVVVSGGPGTGKTYTIARLLALLVECGDAGRILLAAPTGKAAARMAESLRAAVSRLDAPEEVLSAIPLEAATIHRMLGYLPGKPESGYNRLNPLPADTVVVDEASMVDLSLMHRLFSALSPSSRIVLMGDPYQLASVEAGAVLGDIVGDAGRSRWSGAFIDAVVQLSGEGAASEEHAEEAEGLSDGMVHLTLRHRFDETSGIPELAEAIRQGEDEKALALLSSGAAGLEWAPYESGADAAATLKQRIIEGYGPLAAASGPLEALHRLTDFRILCAVNLGPFGVAGINRLAEAVLQGRGLLKPDSRQYRKRPILITMNHYESGLFNGDAGIVDTDPEQTSAGLFAWFAQDAGKVRKIRIGRLPEHETVFAMTVHKSQGSEFEKILLVLPDKPSPVLSRELLYTAVTRAKKNVTLIGSAQIFRQAVKTRVCRTSGLRQALWDDHGC